MKKIFYILIVPLLVLTGSCKKFLDQQPISALSEGNFWQRPTDAPLAMAGIYDGVQGASRDFIEWGDARSDNFMATGTGTEQFNIALNTLTPSLGFTNWARLYTVISRVNTAIEKLPGLPGLTDKDRNNYLAQCYALRSLMYFYIIRLWGDAPVWTESYSLTEPAARARTPVADIMSKVILPDILKAETLIDPARTSIYEVNLGTIYAIEMDIYMWNKDYAKALAASDKMIASNRYGLATTAQWKQIFTAPGTTKENIFNIHYDYTKDANNTQTGTGDRNTVIIGVEGAGSIYQIDNTPGQESPVHTRFQSQRAQGDVRAELTYDARITTSNRTGKYAELRQPYPQTVQFIYPSLSSASTHWPVYRYADMVLLRAEALNKSNNRPGALALVNQIRARAGITTPLLLANFDNERDMETLILNERQIELFAEGKRWFDLVRTGRVLEVMDPEIRKREQRAGVPINGFTDTRKILLPIARAALNANRSLKQNQPWSE